MKLVTENQIHMKGKQNVHTVLEDSRLAEAKTIFFAFFISWARTEMLIQRITWLSCHSLGIMKV